MSANNFAMATVGRLPNVLSSSGHRSGAQRAAVQAEQLSKRNVFTARAKLMQHATVRCVGIAYEPFEGSSILANVDASGRLLVPVPWSRSNYKLYGLRRTEADALRFEMLLRCEPEHADPALFVYLPDFRAWYLNQRAYPTIEDAIQYTEAHPITWKTLLNFRLRG